MELRCRQIQLGLHSEVILYKYFFNGIFDALDFNSPSGGFNPLYFFQYTIKIETLASAPITAPNVATATEEATEPP